MKSSLNAIIVFSFVAFALCRQQCIPKDFSFGSTVCVCNDTHCDDLDPLKKSAKGVVQVFETTKSGDRLKESQLKFGDTVVVNASKTQTITINRNKKYQKIIGFGGAFTDAAGLNIKSLPQSLQNSIINQYYSEKGIEYTLGRIPIGGSDFSTHAYSYDDNSVGDYDLKHFNLTKEDFDFKLPYLKLAAKVSPHKVKYFGSPWAPPAWLKNNSVLNHGGYLIGQPGDKQYKTFAHYLVKFLDAYKANAVPIWGLTVDNEPKCGDDPNYKFNCLGMTPELQRDFIKKDLGPILEAAGYGVNTTDLMIFDDQRSKIHLWAKTILADKEAAKYVSGIAVHWYENTVQNIPNLDIAHEADPSKYILGTEACEEWRGKEKHVYLGSWDTFERYANDIIVDLNHWTSGWVDWNLALDMDGGPNWVKNFVDAPIIVNAKDKEYYKQPMFYALAHYSKFLTPDSIRVEITETTKLDKFETTSFVRPDGGTVVIALNMNDESVMFTAIDSVSHQKMSHLVRPRSLQSFLFYE